MNKDYIMNNEMNTLKINGGLGNQLFQYAFYLNCLKAGVNLGIDYWVYQRESIHGGFLLNELLDEDYKVYNSITFEESLRLNNISFFDRIHNKLFCYYKNHFYESRFHDYSKAIMFLKEKEGIYLEGYWQDFRCVTQCLQDVKNRIVMAKDMIQRTDSVKIQSYSTRETVSIHIRRGDYYSNSNNVSIYGNICTEKYYKAAVRLIRDLLEDPLFIVFSDDISFSIELMKNEKDMIFVCPEDDCASFKDLIRMSLCKHHIIANSSFSWWGAMLGSEGLIIMPKTWNNIQKENTLIIPNSVLIDNNGKRIIH